VEVYPREEAEVYSLSISVFCWHLDWQVSSVAQIFNLLSPLFSAVEHVTLQHEVHTRSSKEHNEADCTEWRQLLGSFRNVKTLRIAEGLVEGLSVWNWTTENSLWSCYMSCRSSHISGAAIPAMSLLHSSTPARTQAAP
jgi:hypothetical protein